MITSQFARLIYFAVIAFGINWEPALAADSADQKIPLGLIEPDYPLDRPQTDELIELGQRLFFEPRLSKSGNTTCATCHDPKRGFAEARAVSVNDDRSSQRRNAPTLLNTGYLPTVMWDGRFQSLERQSVDPFRIRGDMGIDIAEAITRLESMPEYVDMFRRASGKSPTVTVLSNALAAFQRTLVSGNSRFDRFLFAGEKTSLQPIEQRGFEVFTTIGGCLNCHDVFHPKLNPLGGGVALFSDFRFHNLGVGYKAGRMSDIGRYWVTRDRADWGAFRTPTLRNVALTPPYMHDGSLATLRDVIDFYDKGGIPNPNLSPSIRPLHLSEADRESLVAFLHALTSSELEYVAN